MVKTLSSSSSSSSSSSLTSPASSPLPRCSYKKKFKGVRMRSWGSWVSEIRAPNQKTRIWLGSYSTPEAAARAYDAALLCLKGTSASLNFPLKNPSFAIPDTLLSPKSIQKVAAAAAANTHIVDPAPPPPPTPSVEDNLDFGLVAGDPFWFDLDSIQSPKYIDPMMGSIFFDPPSLVIDDQVYEDGDIRLWSFC